MKYIKPPETGKILVRTDICIKYTTQMSQHLDCYGQKLIHYRSNNGVMGSHWPIFWSKSKLGTADRTSPIWYFAEYQNTVSEIYGSHH